MNIAVYHNAITQYTKLVNGRISLKNSRGEFHTTSEETFLRLYWMLSDNRAAFKSDCIEFVLYDKYKPIEFYPEWFNDAYLDGIIFEEHGDYFFYNDKGYTHMNDRAVILRNYNGEIKYLELDTFNSIYTTIGGYVE